MQGAGHSADEQQLLLGRYRIDGILGEGGLGTVWKAFDTRLKRFVAIKTIKRSLTTDLDLFRALEERFAREAEAGSRMGMHPNLVTVYDLVIEEDRTQYLILEFVPNGTLADWIGDAPLSLSEALRVTVDACRALQAAHDVGIVHRDIKPANIFIGTGRRAQLGDFGIAQVDAVSARTHANIHHPGTPLYMSPEQTATMGYMRPESDQYSLGLVLFEMVTGKVYKRLRKREITTVFHTLPAPIVSLIERMTADDPDDRFASMAEVETAISQIRLQDATPASAPLTPEQEVEHSDSDDNDATVIGATPSAETQIGSRADDGTTIRATPRLGLNPVPAIRHAPPLPPVASSLPRVSRRVAMTGIGAVVVGTGVGVLLLQNHASPAPQPPVGTTIAFAGTAQGPTPVPPTSTVAPSTPIPSSTPVTVALLLTVTASATTSPVVNPSPTPLSVPTATPVPTVAPTAAPAPTATDVPPPSPTPEPTATNVPLPTPTRVPTATVAPPRFPTPTSAFTPNRSALTTWADPQGRFSLAYPKTWQTVPPVGHEVFEIDSGDGVDLNVSVAQSNRTPIESNAQYRDSQNQRTDRAYTFDEPRPTKVGGLAASSMSFQSFLRSNRGDVHTGELTSVNSRGWILDFEYYTNGPQWRHESDLQSILDSVAFSR